MKRLLGDQSLWIGKALAVRSSGSCAPPLSKLAVATGDALWAKLSGIAVAAEQHSRIGHRLTQPPMSESYIYDYGLPLSELYTVYTTARRRSVLGRTTAQPT